MSSLREEILARESAARIVEATTLAAMHPLLPDCRARTSIPPGPMSLLWDEHTWGADQSISNPDAPKSVAEWRYKQHFAVAADSIERRTPRPERCRHPAARDRRLEHAHSAAARTGHDPATR